MVMVTNLDRYELVKARVDKVTDDVVAIEAKRTDMIHERT